MAKQVDRRQGFTLVETVVTGTILLSMSLVVTLWLRGALDVSSVSMTQSEMRVSAQQAMNRIVFELMSGSRTAPASPPNATIPAAPGNITMTFYLPTDLDGNGTIIDATGNTEWDLVNAIQYVYVPAQRQLQRVQGGNQVVLANDVQAVTFEDVNIDPTLSINEVKTTMTVQRTTPQGRTVSATVVEIVKLRN